MMKRVISILLCMVTLFSMLSGAALAAEEATTPVEEPAILSEAETAPAPEAPAEAEVIETIPEEVTEEVTTPEETETMEITEDSIDDVEIEEKTGEIETITENKDDEPFCLTPGLSFEELISLAMELSIPAECLPSEQNDYSIQGDLDIDNLVQARSVNATAYSPSYLSGDYKTSLDNAPLGSSQLENVLAIAISQIKYTDGEHSNNLSGVNDSGNYNNYSEFGWQYGATHSAWNALFVNWCARQAGISASIIPVNGNTDPGDFGAIRTDFANIKKGDIIYLFEENRYRTGFVLSVSNSRIYTIEAQRSPNQNVITTDYSFSDSVLYGFVSPNYLSSWDYLNNAWYYREANGNFKTGWVSLNDYTYYLDPDNGGRMVTGWQVIDGNQYYFSSGGVMQTGWEQIGDYWYYFNSSGHMYDDGWLYLDSGTYYIQSNGRMVTGWQDIDGKRYYFRPETNDYGLAGARLSGWVTAGTDNYYYLDPNDNGAMVTGWKTIYSSNYGADKVYYFSTSGVMQTGWLKLSGLWYYLRTESNDYGPMGSRVTGWKTYDDTYCYLDPNNNGAMVIGWKTISGKTYYFDEDGLMQTSWQEIDGNWYYFADSGAMQTGWCKPASIWFYLDPTTGIMQTGWLYLEDGTYYLSRNESTLGYMLTGWVKISGSWHYFNSSGRVQMGWKDYNGDRYYLDPDNNGAALTGTHIIDGVEYTFDEDGALIS